MRISMARRGASCSTIPAHSMRNTKGAALPSMIGSSPPSTSTYRLSIPQPLRAANRCSTVAIVAPLPSPSVVHIRSSTTFSTWAAISSPLPPASVRRNTIPVLAGQKCHRHLGAGMQPRAAATNLALQTLLGRINGRLIYQRHHRLFQD